MAKAITALEHRLRATLFDRTTQGLGLTAEGVRYLDECRLVVERLASVDESMGAAAMRPRGTLVVGAPTFVMQHCLGPALPSFHARHPEIELDFRIVNRLTDADDPSVDVFVVFGWYDAPDFVARPLARTRFRVMASPSYWATHEPPRGPADLERHTCFSFRNPAGTLLDLWEFQRGEERISVKVTGWAASSHRDMVLDLALAGEGVVRTTDITSFAHVRAGRLVPVLEDWEGLHSPPATVYFRPKHRRTLRVRLFLEFVAEAFSRLESERSGRMPGGLPVEKPDWYFERDGRASSVLRRR